MGDMCGASPLPQGYVKNQSSKQAVLKLHIIVIKPITETKATSVKSASAPSD
jgi:hypothetical protein